jgi:hypothetical protein
MELAVAIAALVVAVGQFVLGVLALRQMSAAQVAGGQQASSGSSSSDSSKQKRNTAAARRARRDYYRRLLLNVSTGGAVVLILATGVYFVARANDYLGSSDNAGWLAYFGAFTALALGVCTWILSWPAQTVRGVFLGASLVVMGGLLMLVAGQLEALS